VRLRGRFLAPGRDWSCLDSGGNSQLTLAVDSFLIRVGDPAGSPEQFRSQLLLKNSPVKQVEYGRR